MKSIEEYTEADIEHLTPVEFIRRRPGMFLGSVDALGLARLIREVVVDLKYLFQLEAGPVRVELEKEQRIRFSFEGGIWPGDMARHCTELWNFNPVQFLQYACNLARRATFTHQEGVSRRVLVFEDAAVVEETQEQLAGDPGCTFLFEPESSVLPMHADFRLTAELLEEVAFLIPGLKILLLDHRPELPSRQYFHFPGGISDIFAQRLRYRGHPDVPRLCIRETQGSNRYHIAIAFLTQKYPPPSQFTCYTNESVLPDPGDFLAGIRRGVLAGMKAYLKGAGLPTKGALRVKALKDGLFVMAALRRPDPSRDPLVHAWSNMGEVGKEVAGLVAGEVQRMLNADETVARQVFRLFGYELPGAAPDVGEGGHETGGYKAD